eukprot:TRINITY_DN6894_c0_g1_i1.p1 TRINITY_DN6894_c0_g1~~TRINITY_DN6894_c0_g1_i1.p1  ORF type:complete len:124 (-),score=17.68 TRINITY_DN6894_c0_g1_i1:23-394(-)
MFAWRAGQALTHQRVVGAVIMVACGHLMGLFIGVLTCSCARDAIALAFELAIRDMPLAMTIVINSFHKNLAFRSSVLDGVLVYGLVCHLMTLPLSCTVKLLDRYGILCLRSERDCPKDEDVAA